MRGRAASLDARRDLRPLPLSAVTFSGQLVITMSIGQWDALLSEAYRRGWILLELDEDENPVRAYQREGGSTR